MGNHAHEGCLEKKKNPFKTTSTEFQVAIKEDPNYYIVVSFFAFESNLVRYKYIGNFLVP